MATEVKTSGGIGFAGLLAIVFITLKLLGIAPVAAWSWWWVLSPIWISWGVVLAVLAVIALIALAALAKGR